MTIAGHAVDAVLKGIPIPGLILLGSLSPLVAVQLTLYGVGIAYGVMQFLHLRWVWRNERVDRERKLAAIAESGNG